LIPEKLSDWTLDVVRSLVQRGVFESDRFDFKERLPDSRNPNDKERLVRSCAAFASSDGGTATLREQLRRTP
jgi:hypothetical protein